MRTFRRPLSLAAVVAVAVTALSTAASAHVGDHTHMSFAAGFRHPLSGLDHILAMVTVGLWAAQLGRRAMLVLPLTFPAVMAVGAAAGIGGAPLPWVEIGVAGSVLALGCAVALSLRPSLAVTAAAIAAFALLHGYGHGVELPASASALAYGTGFIAATLLLHFAGIAVGLATQRLPLRFAVRTAGGAIAATGVVLLIVH